MVVPVSWTPRDVHGTSSRCRLVYSERIEDPASDLPYSSSRRSSRRASEAAGTVSCDQGSRGPPRAGQQGNV